MFIMLSFAVVALGAGAAALAGFPKSEPRKPLIGLRGAPSI